MREWGLLFVLVMLLFVFCFCFLDSFGICPVKIEIIFLLTTPFSEGV